MVMDSWWEKYRVKVGPCAWADGMTEEGMRFAQESVKLAFRKWGPLSFWLALEAIFNDALRDGRVLPPCLAEVKKRSWEHRALATEKALLSCDFEEKWHATDKTFPEEAAARYAAEREAERKAKLAKALEKRRATLAAKKISASLDQYHKMT